MFLISWTGWTKEDWAAFFKKIKDVIFFILLSPFLLIKFIAERLYNIGVYIFDKVSRRLS